MVGGAAVPDRTAHCHAVTVDGAEPRELVPRVLSVLVRRGADFATAEDAVQEALIRALSAWRDELPADPTGWLITVAWRAFVDSKKRRDATDQAWFEKMHQAKAKGSAQEQLAQQTEFMRRRQIDAQAETKAFQNLYLILTPKQRAIADQRVGASASIPRREGK